MAIIVDSVNQTARIYMEGNERFTTPIPLPSGTYLMDALSSVTVENYQKDTNGDRKFLCISLYVKLVVLQIHVQISLSLSLSFSLSYTHTKKKSYRRAQNQIQRVKNNTVDIYNLEYVNFSQTTI